MVENAGEIMIILACLSRWRGDQQFKSKGVALQGSGGKNIISIKWQRGFNSQISGGGPGALAAENKTLLWFQRITILSYLFTTSMMQNRLNDMLASTKLSHRALIKQYNFPLSIPPLRNAPVCSPVICDRPNETQQLQQNWDTVRVFPVLLE